eukprot:TRINITY_DN34804_c0_g1_i1.p1 TRINITY_DN34804_c0_g1~~TRINITY_DN34804_c0_g1_i1.p1  ORF type:complete len:508 (+),score=107.66 TRINITY_DN34804_c0_g1_i1:77-1525(+)
MRPAWRRVLVRAARGRGAASAAAEPRHWQEPTVESLRADSRRLAEQVMATAFLPTSDGGPERGGIEVAVPLSIACYAGAYAGDVALYAYARDWMMRGLGLAKLASQLEQGHSYDPTALGLEAAALFEKAAGPTPERMWLLGRVVAAADEMNDEEVAGTGALVLTDALALAMDDPFVRYHPATVWAAGYLCLHYARHHWMSEQQSMWTASGVNVMRSAYARTVAQAAELCDGIAAPHGVLKARTVPVSALRQLTLAQLHSADKLGEGMRIAASSGPFAAGEVIRSVGDKRCASAEDLAAALGSKGAAEEVVVTVSHDCSLPDLRWAEVMLLYAAAIAGKDEDYTRHAGRLREDNIESALADIPEGDFRGWAMALCCHAACRVGRVPLAVRLAERTIGFCRESLGNPQDLLVAPLQLRAALVHLHPFDPKRAKKAAREALPLIPFVTAGVPPRSLAPPRVRLLDPGRTSVDRNLTNPNPMITTE